MDNVLASLASAIGRIVGRLTCSLDCSTTQFGLSEYIILMMVLLVSFVFGRKLVKRLKYKKP